MQRLNKNIKWSWPVQSRSGSHRKVAVEENWSRSINMQIIMSVINNMNESIIKWLWTEKSRSWSHWKVAVEEIWSRSINMQIVMSLIIYMNERKLQPKGQPKLMWPRTEKVNVRVTQKCCSWKDLIKIYKHAKNNAFNH